jgi:hypothetical protein
VVSDRVRGVWTRDLVIETKLPSASASEVLGSSRVRAEPEKVNAQEQTYL